VQTLQTAGWCQYLSEPQHQVLESGPQQAFGSSLAVYSSTETCAEVLLSCSHTNAVGSGAQDCPDMV
jgi:hypothetical protein